MSQYFPKPSSLGANVKIELDLSNFSNKSRFKKCNRHWYIIFCKKTDLANLKSDVDKLDIDKLKNVPSNLNNLKSKVDKLDIGKLEATPADLSKLSNVVKMMLLRKDEYNVKIKNIEDKIPDITSLVTNTNLDV